MQLPSAAANRRDPRLAPSLAERGTGFPSAHFHEVTALTGEIRFKSMPCSLGVVLVAQAEDGVCGILLGDDPRELVSDLERRFPLARLLAGGARLQQLAGEACDLVEQPGLASDLPLVLCGTAFQRRVWRALAAVPAGTTATYGDIARAIGQPGAVRAVGAACGSNPLAVVIPCHRILRSDGGLSGYRWGTSRKRTLLERERRETLSAPAAN